MSQAIKVGIFGAIVLAILAFMILRIEDLELFGGERAQIVAEFETVAGLDDKSTVRVAGVRVGRVDGIELVGQRARVNILLDSEVVLTEGTRAEIANLGLLGDKYILLEPGPTGAPALADGAVIPGTAPPSIDQALAKLNTIGDSISDLTGSINGAGAGDKIGRLLTNLEAVSGDIRALVAANRSQVDATIGNFEAMSASLARDIPILTAEIQRIVGQLGEVVAENRSNVSGVLENFRELSADAQVSVENLNEVTGKLARGEGSIGKLLNSDQAHDELVATLESVQSGVDGLSETLGAVQRLQLELGLESYYLEGIVESRSALQIDIENQGKHAYRVALVDSPFGQEKTLFERETITLPDGSMETTITETLRRDNDPTYSALFGWKLARDARIYAGLIESAGGVQFEYPVLDKKAYLSLEAFDFDREGDLEPHLRLSGRWQFHDSLYLTVGYDDFLESERESFFFGGGVRWRDDTLKYLLGSLPSF